MRKSQNITSNVKNANVMKYIITHTKAALGGLLLVYILAQNVHALSSDVFLDASASATPLQEINTSLDLKAGGTTSVQGVYEVAEEGSVSENTKLTNASENDTTISSETFGEMSWVAFLKDFFAKLTTSLHIDTGTASSEEATFVMLQVREIHSTDAVIDWSPAVFEDVIVYYSTSTVELQDATPHVSSGKFWKRSQVTLKGLTPNTTYFFKAVGKSDTGTTIAESNFTTTSQ